MQSSAHFDPARFPRTVPAPSVIARRKKAYRFACFLCVGYLVAVLFFLFGFALLLYGGTILQFWNALLQLHFGFDMWFGLVILGSLVIASIGTQIYKAFNEFLSIRCFRHLYETCRYIEPISLMEARLLYRIGRHPDRFSYAFSGEHIVVAFKSKVSPDNRTGDTALHSEEVSPFDDSYELEDSSVFTTLNTSTNVPLLDEDDDSEEASLPQQTIDAHAVATSELQKKESQLREAHSLSGEDEAVSEIQQTEASPEVLQRHLRFVISLRRAITLYLVEKRKDASGEYLPEKHVHLLLGNMTYLALLAYLARAPSEWIEANVITEHVYESIKDKTKVQDLFNQHIRRIRVQVRKRIIKEFPHWKPVLDEKDFDIFERITSTNNVSLWRLSPKNCTVSEIAVLDTFYKNMHLLFRSKKARASRNSVQEKKLLSDAKRAIKHYSENYLENYPDDEEGYVGGYLLDYQHELPFRGWVGSFFNACREKYIFCLEQVAECEHRIWQEVRQQEYLNNAVRLYKECAYAATCAPIDPQRGERALRACIRLYQESGDIGEADAFYGVYQRRVLKIQSEWIPEKETKALLAELLLVEEKV